MLSQGQKQLLCIARVMLCLPPMLILDEATSSIDTRTEIRIQQAFASMMQGRTSFIVAHRLSTIRDADVILVMEDGHVVEQGNHEQLLQKNGFYATLYNSQFAAGGLDGKERMNDEKHAGRGGEPARRSAWQRAASCWSAATAAARLTARTSWAKLVKGFLKKRPVDEAMVRATGRDRL